MVCNIRMRCKHTSKYSQRIRHECGIDEVRQERAVLCRGCGVDVQRNVPQPVARIEVVEASGGEERPGTASTS